MSPEHDYGHLLLEIRRRLHDARGRKAAVMVGAGFSRNARHRSDAREKLPDWPTLTRKIAERLYLDPGDRRKVLEAAGATSSAARLAQEFQTAFGRSGLIALVRDAVRDDEFLPSPLHQALLELPWADVFTTNYDRLLERSAATLWRQYYETVTAVSDLPLVRRPRVIKLHGTLPQLDQLVLTEDDYRRYPRTHAPFVAVVQASLTENVLCLIGFSGDDPNFLAWSGWLRDEMRVAAPNAYFFTLNPLRPFQEQLLLQRNIVPVPMSELVSLSKPDAYEEAYSWLFAELARSPEPPAPVWNHGRRYAGSHLDADVVKEPRSTTDHDLIDTAILWRKHRLQFKGWWVLPRAAVDRLWLSTDSWTNVPQKVANELSPAAAMFVLRELVWRWCLSLLPLYDNFVFKTLDPQMERFRAWRSSELSSFVDIPGKTSSVRVEVTEIDEAYEMLMRECLRHAREVGADRRFEEIDRSLEAWSGSLEPAAADDALAYRAYQRALHALARLQHAKARDLLTAWDTSSQDPIWSARRGALFLECGQAEQGTRLLEEALLRVRSVPPSSEVNVANLSAEGISLHLLHVAYFAQRYGRMHQASEAGSTQLADERVILDRLDALNAHGCDPSELSDWLSEATAVEPRRTQGQHRAESFKIGAVNRTTTFGGPEPQLRDAYRAIRFIEDAGLPLTVFGMVPTVAAERLFRNAIRIIAFFAPHEAAGLFLRSRDTKIAEEMLSRNCLAALTAEQVEALHATTFAALQESLDRLGVVPKERQVEDEFWDEQFRVACAVLGRIVVRLDELKIQTLISQLAVLPSASKLINRFQLQEALKECLNSVSAAAGKASFDNLLPELLQTPVRGSAQLPATAKDERHDKDVIGGIQGFSWSSDSSLAIRCRDAVGVLINQISTARGLEREQMCLRCGRLMDAGLLSGEDKRSFLQSLYSTVDAHGLPAETGLLDTIVLSAPQPAGRDQANEFRSKYLRAGGGAIEWMTLSRTVNRGRREDRRVEWTSSDLQTVLVLAREWLSGVGPPGPKLEKAHPFFSVQDDWQQRQLLSQAWLATLETVVALNPIATPSQRDEANNLVNEAAKRGWCVTQSVPFRVLQGYLDAPQGITAIRQGLSDRDLGNVWQACTAIERWNELIPDSATSEFNGMLTFLVSTRRHEYLDLLLQTVAGVLRHLRVDQRAPFIAQISDGLQKLLPETEYRSENEGVFTMGKKLSIRAACALLVGEAANLGVSEPVLDSWAESLRADLFSDVRRCLELHRA
jgi:hypothetical protein